MMNGIKTKAASTLMLVCMFYSLLPVSAYAVNQTGLPPLYLTDILVNNTDGPGIRPSNVSPTITNISINQNPQENLDFSRRLYHLYLDTEVLKIRVAAYEKWITDTEAELVKLRTQCTYLLYVSISMALIASVAVIGMFLVLHSVKRP